jgi:hypothetical protein
MAFAAGTRLGFYEIGQIIVVQTWFAELKRLVPTQ